MKESEGLIFLLAYLFSHCPESRCHPKLGRLSPTPWCRDATKKPKWGTGTSRDCTKGIFVRLEERMKLIKFPKLIHLRAGHTLQWHHITQFHKCWQIDKFSQEQGISLKLFQSYFFSLKLHIFPWWNSSRSCRMSETRWIQSWIRRTIHVQWHFTNCLQQEWVKTSIRRQFYTCCFQSVGRTLWVHFWAQ